MCQRVHCLGSEDTAVKTPQGESAEQRDKATKIPNYTVLLRSQEGTQSPILLVWLY